MSCVRINKFVSVLRSLAKTKGNYLLRILELGIKIAILRHLKTIPGFFRIAVRSWRKIVGTRLQLINDFSWDMLI